MCLIPQIKDAISIALIAAGGIGSGQSMLAAMALGADGVQIGSRFAASKESSAHDNFKSAIVEAKEGETKLVFKKLVPVRLLKNDFFQRVQNAEDKGSSVEELKELLGKGRAKLGMFEGDLEEGELEIGQVSAKIHEIKTAEQIILEIISEYKKAKEALINSSF